MNRIFTTIFFTLIAATQLTPLCAMKRTHEQASEDSSPAEIVRYQDQAQSGLLQLPQDVLNVILGYAELTPLPCIEFSEEEVHSPQNLILSILQRRSKTQKIMHPHLTCKQFHTLIGPFNIVSMLSIPLRSALHKHDKMLSYTFQANRDSALFHIIALGDFNLLEIFAQATGIDLKEAPFMRVDDESLFHHAIVSSKSKFVQDLLQCAGAQAEELVVLKNSFGIAPLHNAAFNGYKNVIKILLTYAGKNALTLLRTTTSNGWTARAYAELNGHRNVLKLLHDTEQALVALSGYPDGHEIVIDNL